MWDRDETGRRIMKIKKWEYPLGQQKFFWECPEIMQDELLGI